jgi:hypothetical protein
MIRLQLTKKQFAELDHVDYDLTAFKWNTQKSRRTFYARRTDHTDGKKAVLLHRVVLSRMLNRELLQSEEVDHIDGNGLNNRRKNLRLVSHQQNMMNMKSHSDGTSVYKGVGFHKKSSKWRARIFVDRHEMHLGLFNSEIEAANAYDIAAEKIFKTFANLNGAGTIPAA